MFNSDFQNRFQVISTVYTNLVQTKMVQAPSSMGVTWNINIKVSILSEILTALLYLVEHLECPVVYGHICWTNQQGEDLREGSNQHVSHGGKTLCLG